MSDHICDKALTIEQHGKDIANLFEGRNETDGKVAQMETTLFGAERNGGGFIKETRETLEVVRLAVTTGSQATSDLSSAVKRLTDRTTGLREILKVTLPPVMVGLMGILMWWLTNGRAP